MEGGNIRSVFKSIGRKAKQFVEHDLPTALIHKGIPIVANALGTAAGATLATLSGNPELAPVGAKLGQVVGNAAGQYAAKEIGKVAGRGLTKGSPEAKAFGARMKALRDAKKHGV